MESAVNHKQQEEDRAVALQWNSSGQNKLTTRKLVTVSAGTITVPVTDKRWC
jgi:hypothetical protein